MVASLCNTGFRKADTLRNFMRIARIVSSNSHIDYLARVLDDLDAIDAPGINDYGFGSFVSIEIDDDSSAIGIVYNSLLVNPDYANYGPRLSPAAEIGEFSPDFLNEQGQILGILLLGSQRIEGTRQGIPRRILKPGAYVENLNSDAIQKFHQDSNEDIAIHYYAQIIANAGQFAFPLLENVIEQLEKSASEEEIKRLSVLSQNLKWQQTIGTIRG